MSVQHLNANRVNANRVNANRVNANRLDHEGRERARTAANAKARRLRRKW